MDNPSYSVKSEEPSLLMLNDDCLSKIFQFLKLKDYVNFAQTCERLRNVADMVRFHTLKKIEIEVRNGLGGSESIENKTLSHDNFTDMLSVFGRHLLSIKIFSGDSHVLQTIRDNCENLNRVELSYFNGTIEIQGFNNLKELKISHSVMLTTELKSCFESNPGIESLEYHEEVNDNFMQLLHLLPKLKSLELPLNPNQPLQHLLNLNGLTKLSFHSRQNCNNLLNELATKLNLVELDFSVDIDQNTFEILNLFRNLEVLSVSPNVDCWLSSWYWRYLPGTTVFPTRLKHIKLCAISMSCSTFLSIVNQLKFLEIFDLSCADIFRDFEPDYSCDLSNDDYNIIPRIVNELRFVLNQRTLNVIYPDERRRDVKPRDAKLYLYKSDHLKIGRRVFDWEQEQSNKTILKVWSHYDVNSENDSSFLSTCSLSSDCSVPVTASSLV